ncbi:MAG TPA: c-type cytochrome domain-containing protein [Candidatus Limnocylindrales bacterium]|nr:c-type cytochrome domain-containing protein [Candidatus Limnocylindrales bacterium]
MRKKAQNAMFGWGATAWVLVFFLGASHRIRAEDVDLSKLPPPAAAKIDFSRDIKPILEKNCFKCHSDEKPKSHFRLTSREAALKGGEHGVDIIQGNSTKSPLIHYVSRLVADMEMPPEGRGTPLTAEQIGLLRAWIDQGVEWEKTTVAETTEVNLSPGFQWTSVSGDSHKFRELYWQHNEWLWGLENYEVVSRPSADSKITSSGHAYRDDYLFEFDAEKNDLGFSHFGWSQFRKYYDDTGGYYPAFAPPAYDLNRDLHLDVGRAWVDFGLTLPRWPVLTLGYEYQYRRGDQATLQWGPVTHGTNSKSIFPAFRDLSEKVHILKFDVEYVLAGFDLRDNFRGEWYRLESQEFNDSGLTLPGGGMALTTAAERQSYFQGANTFHVEKQFTDWLFGSGGYLYSKLTADGSMNVDTVNAALLNTTIPYFPGWHADAIELERESHVFSIGGLLGPWEGLSLSLATQNEWTRQMGFGGASVTLISPLFISPPFPEQFHSDWDRAIFSQDVGLRFTKIPFTTLYAEARFQQEDAGQFEQEQPDFSLTPYLRQTDVKIDLSDLRVGFNTSPWRRFSLSGHYRRYDNETDYNNRLKESMGKPFEGYPALITERDVLSNEVEGKLAYEWAAWLKTSLTYQWLQNHYRTTTDPVTGGISTGGELLAGAYDAQITSLNTTLTPWRRLFLSGSLVYQHARTETAAFGSPSVAPYVGDIYSAIVSADYGLNEKTDLVVSYAFSTADFTQDNSAAGLPLGINYHQHTLQAGVRRQVAKGKTVNLQYRFYRYQEPSSGGINDFDAHAIFATFTCRLP